MPHSAAFLVWHKLAEVELRALLPFQTSALEDVFVCACPRNAGSRSFQRCPLPNPSCCGAAISSLPSPPALSAGDLTAPVVALSGSISGLCFPAPSGQAAGSGFDSDGRRLNGRACPCMAWRCWPWHSQHSRGVLALA